MIAEEHVDGGGIGHFFNVGACRKGLFISREYDDVHIGIGVEMLKGPDQFLHQLHIQCIEHLRPVELYEGTVILLRDKQRRIGHSRDVGC